MEIISAGNMVFVIFGIVLLFVIMILSSISAGKAKEAKCFSSDRYLQKSHQFSKLTAIISAVLIVGLIILLLIAHYIARPELVIGIGVGNKFSLFWGFLLVILLIAVVVMSSISAVYAHESKCKRFDRDADLSYQYSTGSAIGCSVVAMILGLSLFIYIYNEWKSPLIAEIALESPYKRRPSIRLSEAAAKLGGRTSVP